MFVVIPENRILVNFIVSDLFLSQHDTILTLELSIRLSLRSPNVVGPSNRF